MKKVFWGSAVIVGAIIGYVAFNSVMADQSSDIGSIETNAVRSETIEPANTEDAAAEDVVENVQEQAQELANEAEEAVTEVVEQAEGTVANVVEQATEVAEDVENTLEGAATNAVEGAANLLGNN